MDLISYTKYFGALAAIIILLLVVAFIFKKMTQSKPKIDAQSHDIFNSKSSSLFVQEVLPIDQKTKIIIIGRDNVRHVILLGETHSNLIETVSPDKLSQNQTDFSAGTNVGSISMGATAAEAIQASTSPEPDFSNIKAEPVSNEPKLAAKIAQASAKTQTVKAQEVKAQVEDDLQDKTQSANSELQAIKNKLQDAKNLATPSKD